MGVVANSFFNVLFRRNYVFLGSVFLGAFAFEMAFDTTTDAAWNRMNKGRRWADIKQKYMTAPEGDDDDDDE